ncbi:MAG: excinuclease ABC subunit UvrB [Clostridiales bacterium]|nr:excinuclease ABC subunit UvrB [Clostridiales bacterium]MCI6589060.1 excinuclease ABC subunit UvrB [Clostridiales bacterium]MDY3764520.1 excinuclease ABC subunit UvrB [Candidatus Ventricola sp.]
MQEGRFVLKSPFKPQGDQPQAIEALAEGVASGMPCQVLLGVTGSGKTYTMASVIERVQRPTLVIAHNKTLAAQLCAEFREFFPDSAVEYFVSYYDYYQPEAYIASTDTYIEKDSSVNEEIERLRHSATAALRERRDVIVVASVSCIYSMGDPSEYEGMMISLRPGMTMERDDLVRALVEIQYDRSDVEFDRGTFRVRGDVVEIFPAGYEKSALRVEFFGEEIDRISAIDVVTGHVLMTLAHVSVYPATHYATPRETIDRAIEDIEHDLDVRVAELKQEGDLLSAQRLAQRTRYDIEMLRELGYCTGIENYSRYFDGRKPGDAPYTLLDYFPEDYIVFVDESHVTLPQIRAMYNGDRARKQALVSYGFRLPSAFDNRPLTFPEFEARIGQLICVSATPAPYELERAGQVVEQIIRPTGLLDPLIDVRPATGQVDDLYAEIQKVTQAGFRVLVTTLTKKMAESLTAYLTEMKVKVRYLHSDVQTMERQEIIRDLRLGVFDVLVGINLLREGLDLPEVALVAILDADKEGFLRSEVSMIQTVGRAARNAEGRVIMYADHMTESINKTIFETQRRRQLQQAFNEAHGIVPRTVMKSVRDLLQIGGTPESADKRRAAAQQPKKQLTEDELHLLICSTEEKMLQAAANLDFELAAKLRDKLFELQGKSPEEIAEETVAVPQRKRRQRRSRYVKA